MASIRQIKASAGSGKTYTLTSTFLRLLAGASDASWSRQPAGCRLPGDGQYGWQEILAATFTNKAATEMRERLLARLKDCALSPKSREEDWTPAHAKEAVDRLLHSYSALNIRTIDSLLHLLVRLSALDFDLNPDFEPHFNTQDITGPVFDIMAEEARNGDTHLADLFRRSCNLLMHTEKVHGFLAGERIRSQVMTLVSLMLESDGWTIDDLASPENTERHIQSMLADFRSMAASLKESIEAEGLSAQVRLLNALDKCISSGNRLDALPLNSTLLTKSHLDEALKKASQGQASAETCALYESLRDAFFDMSVLKGARSIMPYVELARALFDRLEEYERKNGVLASCQIPRLAIRAADDREGVNELFCRMGSRITHLLIDEFQDTSRDQWFALQPLVEEALSHGGSLTFVGDVKQAIYGWRKGDASLFDSVPRLPALLNISEAPSFETLPFNWRSRERIVAWNNALFTPLGDRATARALLESLAEGDEELLEEQTSLLCNAFRGAAQSAEHCAPGGVVHLHDLTPGMKDEEIAALLPELVESLGSRHNWGDICILVRSKQQAADVASCLMARKIPIVTQGSLTLSSQPVISQLTELLRFLNCPDDDLAFWSVLCGRDLLPPCTSSGNPLPDMQSLRDWVCSRKGSRRMYRQFRQDFPHVWQEIFAPLYETGGLLTAYDTVMEILNRWEVLERCPDSEGFIRRFLEILFNAEEKGIADLSGFLDMWDLQGKEERAPLPESMDAVSIMTMHKSKGLEFDVVLLPWPVSSGKRTSSDIVFWNSHGTGMFAPLSKAMGRPYLRHTMEEIREALHLVYVGMTRAISELHCFLPDPDSGPLPSLLGALVSRQRPHLQEKDGDAWWGDIPSCPLQKTRRQQNNISSEQDMACFRPAEDSCPGSPYPLPASSSATKIMSAPAPVTSSPAAPEETWRPMAWLPRLRIFHTPLEEWTFSAKQRGTLIHHCLERLRITGHGTDSAIRDAREAAVRGISSFPLIIPDRDTAMNDVTASLTWYASLPETAHWLAFGDPEHTLMDSQGHSFRVDLLVNDGRECIAVEYKTGTIGTIPVPQHVDQLSHYLELLRQASHLPVRGVLVYLDRQQLFPLTPGDSHGRP